jgi:hypothetical protein
MLMQIINFTGSLQQAILLAAGLDMLRVAIPGQDDAVEFRRVGGLWFGEADEPVLIDFEDELWFDQEMTTGWPAPELSARVN